MYTYIINLRSFPENQSKGSSDYRSNLVGKLGFFQDYYILIKSESDCGSHPIIIK